VLLNHSKGLKKMIFNQRFRLDLRSMKLKFIYLGLLSLLSVFAFAQDREPKVVQFSGFAMTSDSLQGVPYTHVTIRNRGRVATASAEGFFSFAAQEGDTLYFTCIGFKPSVYILPKVLDKEKYSVIQLMSRTEYYIGGVIIYPWGDKDGFKRAFRDLKLPKDDLQRAEENMDPQMLAALAQQLQPSGAEAASYSLRSGSVRKSYYGQSAPNNLLNPFAWYSLYKAAKNGDLKIKDKSDLPPLKDE
jgi:hypothetical protein